MISHHFGSKDGLYAAVLEAQSHGLVQAWGQVIDRAVTTEPGHLSLRLRSQRAAIPEI